MITFATLIGISIENWRNWTWHYLAHLVAEFFFLSCSDFPDYPFFFCRSHTTFFSKGGGKM